MSPYDWVRAAIAAIQCSTIVAMLVAIHLRGRR